MFYIFVYVPMYVLLYDAGKNFFILVGLCVCTCLRMCLCTNVFEYICTYTCKYVCMSV